MTMAAFSLSKTERRVFEQHFRNQKHMQSHVGPGLYSNIWKHGARKKAYVTTNQKIQKNIPNGFSSTGLKKGWLSPNKRMTSPRARDIRAYQKTQSALHPPPKIPGGGGENTEKTVDDSGLLLVLPPPPPPPPQVLPPSLPKEAGEDKADGTKGNKEQAHSPASPKSKNMDSIICSPDRTDAFSEQVIDKHLERPSTFGSTPRSPAHCRGRIMSGGILISNPYNGLDGGYSGKRTRKLEWKSTVLAPNTYNPEKYDTRSQWIKPSFNRNVQQQQKKYTKQPKVSLPNRRFANEDEVHARFDRLLGLRDVEDLERPSPYSTNRKNRVKKTPNLFVPYADRVSKRFSNSKGAPV